MNATQLEALLHELIPISRAMGIRVADLHETGLTLAAPLAANHNHAGAGFAGSAYSLASLAGWAFLRRLVEREGLSAELVLGEARIRYRRPLLDDLRAALTVDDETQAALLARLRRGEKARLNLTVHLPDAADPAATFTGIYFAKPR